MKKVLRQISESFLFAWKALKTNVLRTVLSLLGVTIGIFCIISVSALVDSIGESVRGTFSIISDDMIFIQKMPMMPEESGEYRWWDYIKRKEITQKEAKMLRERMTQAEAVSYQVGTFETIEYKNSNASSVRLAGVSYDYERTIKLNIGKGRYFTETEADAGRNVAIIGPEISEKLFGEDDPLGKVVKIGGYKVKIIGEFEKAGNTLIPGGFDDAVMIPVLFSSKFIDLRRADASVIVKAKEGVSNAELIEETVNTFRPIRKLKPVKDDDFSIIEATFFSEILDGVFSVVRIAGILIGLCALLVGGFGIMNIMFVSVKERTKQIGIQKSLGATNYFILFQFLFESIFLCVIGGIIGLFFIYLIILLANSFLEFDLVLSTGNVITGIFVSVTIGLLSGFIPSRRAAKLNPVDAIRG